IDAGEAGDGAAVEADALGEGLLELGGRDGHRLQRAEDVGEPEPDKPDVPFLDGAKDILLLTIHALILPYAEGPGQGARRGVAVRADGPSRRTVSPVRAAGAPGPPRSG